MWSTLCLGCYSSPLVLPHTFNGNSSVRSREGGAGLGVDRRFPHAQVSLERKTSSKSKSDGCTVSGKFGPVGVPQRRVNLVGEEVCSGVHHASGVSRNSCAIQTYANLKS